MNSNHPLRKMTSLFFALLLLFVFALPNVGCAGNDDDSVGEKIEEGMEEVADEIEDAGDEIEDKID